MEHMGIVSLIPPVLAIVVAILFRNFVVALFIAVGLTASPYVAVFSVAAMIFVYLLLGNVSKRRDHPHEMERAQPPEPEAAERPA